MPDRAYWCAVIDSGKSTIFIRDFRNADGTTRILYLWDQDQGKVYTREDINEALASGSRSRALERVPSRDVSGHGNSGGLHRCGKRQGEQGRVPGVAFASELVVVKLGTPLPDSFLPRRPSSWRRWILSRPGQGSWGAPLAVNISFGKYIWRTRRNRAFGDIYGQCGGVRPLCPSGRFGK